jgi:hypothetical protein
MPPFRFSAQSPLSRRTFLRGTGVALALPWLEAMGRTARAADGRNVPRRMVAIQTNMGILPQYFFPEKAGPDYESTPYLAKLGRTDRTSRSSAASACRA